jgi:hypothetical protein
VYVETAAAAGEQAVVGPARAFEDGPVQSEADQPYLSAVRVSRQHEVDVVIRKIVEGARIVQQE